MKKELWCLSKRPVFDDDFFREPKAQHPPVEATAVPMLPLAPEPIHVPVITHVAEPVVSAQPVLPVVEENPALWPQARVPSFAGYAGGESSPTESDELDIPAFLRKKH